MAVLMVERDEVPLFQVDREHRLQRLRLAQELVATVEVSVTTIDPLQLVLLDKLPELDPQQVVLDIVPREKWRRDNLLYAVLFVKHV
jgi:hypothetical protein